MQSNLVVGIGELLWDCFGDTRRPGGAPTNVVYHAAQLGMPSSVVSRVGCDPSGDELLAVLRARGVSTETIQRDEGHPTGWVTVEMNHANQPRYTIHENVAWDHIAFDDKVASVIGGASAVCYGTLAQRCAASRATIQAALDANKNALLVYDVNLRPPWYSREAIEASMRQCRIVKLNDDEVPEVATLLDLGTPDADRFAAALREAFGVRIVCITRGERGCLVLSPDERIDVPGRQVDVVDTVGAGDAFTAAFVCGLLWNWPLDVVAPFANQVGGMVAGHRGAMPDLKSELTSLRRRVAASQHSGPAD